MSVRRQGRWHGLLAALCACALAGCLLPALADSAAPDPEAQATLDRSVRFLQDAQNLDGGFGGRRGGLSDPDFSAWAAYALAAAGINPQDQAQPGGVDVFTYLTRRTAELTETTDFDRVALVALASGTSPHSFGGVDPIDTVLSRQLPDGSFSQQAGVKTGWINSTIWSIFPLSAIDSPVTDAAVQSAASWLVEQQRVDGGWGGTTAASAPDSDMVGAALQALNAAGLHGTEAQRGALEFLQTRQGPDGGFREEANSPTNSATTAWVVQGMWSAGVDPRAWRTDGGADPLSFLASLQRADGSIGWTASDDTNSLWMTAQVGPALAGATYPLAAVPRAVKAPIRPAPPQPVAAGHRHRSSHQGHGGTGVVHRDGVIAGGGGRGAPVFSGPQPQSGGSTPHGPRQVDATPTSLRPPSQTPSFDSSSSTGAGSASERDRRGNGAGDGIVEGLLVGGAGPKAPAAPGLFGADSGGDTGSAIALALLAALLGAGAIGSRRERAGMRAA
jgi:hypothetical protein